LISQAAILSTGDELTTGRVVDTNSAYIADRLFLLGVEVVAVLKVGDVRERLLWALAQARELADLVIGTGGLGPTADDLTNEVVAEFVGARLVLHEEIVAALKRRMEARGLPWTPNNAKQALLPEGAEVVPNPVGSAPGFRIEIAPQKTLFWLPGVPREMEAMLAESVLPWVAARSSSGKVMSRTFKVYGLTESRLDHLLQGLSLPAGSKLSFRVHQPDLSLRLVFRGSDGAAFEAALDEIRRRIGPYIYGEGEVTLEEIVGRLLLEKGRTLAAAESCTGGFLGHRITRVAGSSSYFKGTAVVYSNEAKVQLGVKPSTLERHGAVSRETALEMAQAARAWFGSDMALSVTGIAGPSGGTETVPVGTVWVGLAANGRADARDYRLQGERERVIQGASQAALNWLRSCLASSK
jgi:nicotinamide-nucleotide amidase